MAAVETSVDSTRPRRGRLRGVDRFGAAVLAVLTGISLIPAIPFVVDTGIDPSWGVGLTLALRDHLRFGHDVVFTFGPLGFLVAPSMAVPTLGLLAYAVRIPLYAAVAALVQRRLRRSFGTSWAARLASVALSFPISWVIVGPLGYGGEVVVVPVLVGGALGLERLLRGRPPLSIARSAGLGAVAGALLLVKFDAGVVPLALSLLLAWPEAGRVRRVAATVAGFVAALLSLWLLTGQRIGDLGPWLVRSIDVLRGFSAAMPWRYRPSWTTNAVRAAALLTGVALVVDRRSRPRLGLATYAYGFVFVSTLLAQSFRRYDPGHVLRFIAVLMLALVLSLTPLRAKLRARASMVAYAVAASLLTVITLGVIQPGPNFPAFGRSIGDPPFVHPSNGWRVAIRTVTFAVSSQRRNARVEREHERLGRQYAIPENVRAVARGRTVHVEPWETSAVWVHGWTWRPLPVFQSYSAYTNALDELNASVLRDPRRAPQVVLTQDLSIDGRAPRHTSPETQFTLLCWYRPAAQGGGWTAFERRARSACGAPAVGTTRQLRSAEPLDVTGDDSAITVVRFSGLDRITAGVAGQPPTITFNGVWTKRLIAGTERGAHVMALPRCLRDRLTSSTPGDGGYDPTTWSTLAVTGAGSYTATVETVPYDCGA